MDIFELIKEFEKRTKWYEVRLELYSDGTSIMYNEDNIVLFEATTLDELHTKLKEHNK